MLQRLTGRNTQRLNAAAPLADILSLATVLPEYRLAQEQTLQRVKRLFPHLAHLESVFANSGIATRYSCVPLDWFTDPHRWKDRNAIYERCALDLLEKAARRAIDGAGLAPSDIGAVATVSSTGISVPSLDARLVNRLPLDAGVERLPIFGLGCAGGVSGLARAARLTGSPDRPYSLLLTVELCSINFRLADEGKAMFISSALFGDGAAGVVLRSGLAEEDGPHRNRTRARLIATGEKLWPGSEEMMGWSVEDDGLGIVISTHIPQFARAALRGAAGEFLARHGLELGDIAGFVTHPGGRKVLEAIEEALDVERSELAHAWDVLRDFGNMSSPTVLFVLERALASAQPGLHLMIALGPGFTASFALLQVAAD